MMNRKSSFDTILVSFIFLMIMLLSISCDKRMEDVKFSVKIQSSVPGLVNKHINICVLGNSYSNDSFCYVPFILKEYGITCKIEIYYRGSLSLHDLDEQWLDDDETGRADIDGKDHSRLHFRIDTRKDRKWKLLNNQSAKAIVSSDDWDIISIQQGGRRCQFEETYYPYLDNVIKKIDDSCLNHGYKLTWFMAYNEGRDNANKESVETQKKIVEEFPFELVFPVATAVFSCQENEVISELGDSKYRKMYAADNVHLQEGLPCYVASLTVAQSIMDYLEIGKTVVGNTIRPTQGWIESISGITPNGQSIGVTEENCSLAQRAAIQANLHPFEIIPVQ